ncbi:MAG: UvrB/UvrC motif-containing protein [Longimicrobiales bacterium]
MSNMVCDNCGSTEAVVHLTQIVNNQMSTHRLCEKCAAEKGLESAPEPSSIPLTDFLAQMGKEPVSEGDASAEQCSFCGLTFRDFRETGRLGCPHCYETYASHLQRLLRRVHGSTQHVGKVYLPPDPTASDLGRRVEALRRKLNRAVEAEDFERAALLRDEIKSLGPA